MNKMETGLQQFQRLEARLIEIIREDHTDINARLEAVEAASIVIQSVAANLQSGLQPAQDLKAKVMGMVDQAILAGLKQQKISQNET